MGSVLRSRGEILGSITAGAAVSKYDVSYWLVLWSLKAATKLNE